MKIKVIFATAIAAALAALLAISLAGCSGGGSSNASGSGAKTLEDIDTSSFPTTPLKLYNEVPSDYHGLPTITPDELKAKIDSGEQMVIVDVNSASMYADGHIDGAISIPWSTSCFTQDPELPRGVPLYFYCVCADEEDSGAMGMSAVKDWGYRNITLLKGGTPAWQKAGYELVAS